jgi:hypothetical protein
MDPAKTLKATPGLAAPGSPPTVEVLGVPLALTDYDGTLDWIDAATSASPRHTR